MRNILLIAFFFGFCPAIATAQSPSDTTESNEQEDVPVKEKDKDSLPKVHAGIRLGANMSQIEGNETFRSGSLPGIVGGPYIEVIRKRVGIQVEGLVNFQQYDVLDTVFGGGRIKTINVDVPVLFKLRIVRRLWIELGPQFSTLVSADHHGGTEADARRLFQSENFSGVAGLQVKLPNHFMIGARYVLGLIDINDNGGSFSGQPWKTQSAQLYAAFRFY